jgi:hypothetical protein
LNYGYVYQPNEGNKGYVGVSSYFLPLIPVGYPLHAVNLNAKSVVQVNSKIQYGRVFSKKQDLLKISFDYFLYPFGDDNKGFISYSTIGIFVEKNFGKDLPLNGYSFGVSLNWSIWDMFIIGDQNRKYFRKYKN